MVMALCINALTRVSCSFLTISGNVAFNAGPKAMENIAITNTST